RNSSATQAQLKRNSSATQAQLKRNSSATWRKLALLIAFLFLQQPIFAQTDSVRLALNHIFQHIDKSQIPSQYLYEYGYGFVPEGVLDGIRRDSNAVEMSSWKMAYYSVLSSHVLQNPTLPYLPQVIAQWQNHIRESEPIALPVAHLSYDMLNPESLNLGLFTLQNQQIYDVSNRTQSPYIAKSMTAIAPTRATIEEGEAEFVYRSDFYYTNTGLSITTFEADFQDGAGWQTLVANTPKRIAYTTAGTKRISYRLTFSNGTQKEGHSPLYVKNPVRIDKSYQITAANSEVILIPANPALSIAGGRATVFYSSINRAARRISKPLIIVEGYDLNARAPMIQKEN
ncbi:MAG: hypothetical protein EAY75_01575, partial [Bacteroidetes bacterium]